MKQALVALGAASYFFVLRSSVLILTTQLSHRSLFEKQICPLRQASLYLVSAFAGIQPIHTQSL